ncbi:uncharacterized protein conserved in bacteria [Anaerolinea thermolimosa]|uniref:cyclic-di-AMP receptor n=1 Tax=Anaerolinea thermolimosa TaxID=229919 RepID=UPI0007856435|nr:cyclic-di-AMP receptor [Anaerolinea thermolimosa]GAP07138.1 uncharacterized protein conserved in bacteria [Anaerolinea thermolimosa]
MPDENRSVEEQVDLLVVVFLASEQVSELSGALIKNNFRVTLVNASGGLLQSGITCLFIGINRSRYDVLIELIGSICHTHRRFIPAGSTLAIPESFPPLMIEVEVGAAHVFTLEVEHYETF